MASGTKWKFEADFWQACNCDYGCPCEFEAPPTKGFCQGLGIWRISKGSYGKVSLDRLSLGFAIHKPETIRVEHSTGFMFKNAEVLSAKECRSAAPGLSFNWPDKSGFLSHVKYGN